MTKDGLLLKYLGQVGFSIKGKTETMLIDPYLSDYVDKNCSDDEVKWVRKYPAPVLAEELDYVDCILCTHGHYDHADPETLGKIARINKKAKFIVPNPIVDMVAAYGVEKSRIIGAFADKEIVCGEFRITSVPAAHESLQKNENGEYAELGYIVETIGIKLFHAGDCCVYDGLSKRIKGVNIAMLPINGRDYYRYSRDIIGNMNTDEAIELSRECGVDLLIPTHFDLYDINQASPAHFVERLFKKGNNQRFHIFMPAEEYFYDK